MMSLAAIERASKEEGSRARKAEKLPYVPYDSAEIWNEHFSIPSLGTFIPKGWEVVDEILVDSSGWGRESEPALTLSQFKATMVNGLECGFGYAVREAGQFQVVVGVYKKKLTKPSKKRKV